jgi:hypothetical protein
MTIKFVRLMNSGYFSLKAVAKLKNFPIDHPFSDDYSITIPDEYIVVTDGILWDAIKKPN